MSDALIPKISAALETMEPAEVQLICLAVLHGVPLSQLASKSHPQEVLQTTLMGSLKKLRKSLTEAGLSSATLSQNFKG